MGTRLEGPLPPTVHPHATALNRIHRCGSHTGHPVLAAASDALVTCPHCTLTVDPDPRVSLRPLPSTQHEARHHPTITNT